MYQGTQAGKGKQESANMKEKCAFTNNIYLDVKSKRVNEFQILFLKYTPICFIKSLAQTLNIAVNME